MANLGYIQMVRHCNQNCGFCSNPETPFFHDLDQYRTIVDDFAARGYFGVILTGGEPTLSPVLPQAIAYARSRDLHVRLITNGQKMADASYTKTLIDAGLQHVHLSLHTHRAKVEDFLTGTPGSLHWAEQALDHLGMSPVAVNLNTVINRYNCDHLHETVDWMIDRFPFIRHVVWNNLDPSIGRATANTFFTARLRDLEYSLALAMRRVHDSGRTFRVERVPLCYMTDFAHCSTETRKIVKGEERIVHFLDDKGTVRQTSWGHLYADVCATRAPSCSASCRTRPATPRGAPIRPAWRSWFPPPRRDPRTPAPRTARVWCSPAPTHAAATTRKPATGNPLLKQRKTPRPATTRLLARGDRGRSRPPPTDRRSPMTSPELEHFDPAKGQMTLSLDAGLYPIEVLYGAAFVLLDRAYVLLDRDGEDGRNSRHLVHLRSKTATDEAGLRALAGEFGNELLTQALRRQIVKQNGKLIEDITTRALAGAAGGSAPVDFLEDDDGLDFLDDPLGIAVPWEDKYPKKGGGNP